MSCDPNLAAYERLIAGRPDLALDDVPPRLMLARCVNALAEWNAGAEVIREAIEEALVLLGRAETVSAREILLGALDLFSPPQEARHAVH